MASLECPEHGWDIGDLGCWPCDRKNNNPWGRAAVAMTSLSKAARDMNAVIVLSSNYAAQIQDP